MPYRSALVLAAALTAFALPAGADPLDARAAATELFASDGVEVARYPLPGLSEQETAALMAVAQTQRYYAAVAYAPDAGIMAEPTVLAGNYHSPDAARAAALSGCDGRRQGGHPCTLALEVRPAGWQARALMLSADATTGFNDEYRRASGRRAFAASATSGQWGIGRGRNAAEDALTACRGDSQVSDCAVVIAD
jgi:hypothetical protein